MNYSNVGKRGKKSIGVYRLVSCTNYIHTSVVYISEV